ncbi:cell division protein [Parasphingopyxis sp. CP4]|uniref:cell division protein FtsX n=1 Tax=Parasphingopyxis sp. CP4 TaxID=2724527 RepID=UPI00159FB0A3|nr:cell division protein [Parasphingopyxis sp. CP4]QLC22677.1 cell division protein [Parasphingopyxis sp. CP4]
MTLPFAATPAERRLLTEGRLSGPMPWVIAIMMFLTVLAAAGGLALNHAASNVTGSIAQRITVQIVEANPDIREQQTRAAMAALQAMDGVNEVIRVPDSEIDALMEPWIGAAGQEEGIPVPTMIDADLNAETHADLESVEEAILAVAPSARVDDHAQFLAPLAGLIGSLTWLALALVLLTASALAASVILAVRAALNTHRATIEVLHLMGATDVQIARLFQRRIAIDALLGGIVGFLSAIIVLLLLGQRIGAVGSELLGSASLPLWGWFTLLLLPLLGAVMSTFVARFTVIGVLRKML